MDKQIDYISLMQSQNEVGVAPARLSRHRNGDRPELLDEGQVSFIFVLQGELQISFNSQTPVGLVAQQMIAVDKFQISELQCKGDTVIFEFVVSEKMSSLMLITARTFDIPCSEAVDIKSQIKEWCKNIFDDLIQQPERNNDYYYTHCRILIFLLLKYHRWSLETLFASLAACSISCDLCPKNFVRRDTFLAKR